MDDLNPGDFERAAEEGRKTGRAEEKDKQRDLDQAQKEGRQQERSREERKGLGTGIKIVLGIVVLVIILIAAALLTLSVTVTNDASGVSLPFTANYGVSFPDGETITIGNVQIKTLSSGDLIITDIDDVKQNMVVGDTRQISVRRAVITTLGAVMLMDTTFQIDLKYKGERDNRAYFDMAVHTSKQVPDYLLRLLLPREIDARPI
ncbi:MAG: hypothetical protein ABFC78_00395 [Methanoregula sp.]